MRSPPHLWISFRSGTSQDRKRIQRCTLPPLKPFGISFYSFHTITSSESRRYFILFYVEIACWRWNLVNVTDEIRFNIMGDEEWWPSGSQMTGVSYFICGLCDFSRLYWMHWSIYCGLFNNVPKNLIDVLRVGLGRQGYDTHRLWFPYIFHTHSEKVSFFGGLTPGALVLHRSQIQQTKDNKHSPKNHPWPLTTTIPSPLYSQCLPPRLWVPVTALLLTKLHWSLHPKRWTTLPFLLQFVPKNFAKILTRTWGCGGMPHPKFSPP